MLEVCLHQEYATMILTSELTPETESRLQTEAARNGLKPTEYARKLIEDNLPSPKRGEVWRVNLEPTE